MNIDYFAVKESPKADSGAIKKKDAAPNGPERRDFVSSYQAARQQREDRIEAAQNRAAARERREQSDVAQTNRARRDRDRELAQSAAGQAKEKSKAERAENREGGKSLPSSQQNGNSLQPNAQKKQEEKDALLAAEKFSKGLKEGSIQMQSLQAQESELLEQENTTVTGEELLLEPSKVSESEVGVRDEAEAEADELLSTVVAFSKPKVESGEEINSLEQSTLTDSDKTEAVLSGETGLAGEPGLDVGQENESLDVNAEATRVTEPKVASDVSGTLPKLKNNEEAVNSRAEDAELDAPEVESTGIPQNTVLGETKGVTEEKITTAPAPSIAIAQKTVESNTSNAKNKSAASQAITENSSTKMSADGYFREGLSGDALEEQSLLKAEIGKADIKSSLSENLSVSELAIKEAKSSIGAKPSDFAKTLAAEKLPLRETIELPVSHKNWGEALAEKTALLVGQRGNFARLNLVPHNLGPLEVRVQLQGETSSLEFIAVNPATKDAIESAIPRLREMFESGGLTLGDVNVNSQSKKDGEAERMLNPQKGEALGDADMDAAEEEVLSRVGGSLLNGRVDFYA